MEAILTAVNVNVEASIHANAIHLSKFSCNNPLYVIADLKNRSQTKE